MDFFSHFLILDAQNVLEIGFCHHKNLVFQGNIVYKSLTELACGSASSRL